MTRFGYQLRQVLPWLIVAVLACSLTLFAMLPAAWIAPQFAQRSGGHIVLANPVGSLWHGSGTLRLAAGSDSSEPTELPGQLEWRTAFWPLFTGQLRMTLNETEAMAAPVELRVTRRETTLGSGSVAVPASLLDGLGAPFNTLALRGPVRLDWTDWRVFGPNSFGRLTVNLTDIESRISRVKPLGGYRMVFEAQGDHASLVLSTRKGPLLLDGEGEVRGQRFTFKGTARSTPESTENLRPLLNLLGRRSPDGSYALTFDR
jgi:general secretion pathway protein N